MQPNMFRIASSEAETYFVNYCDSRYLIKQQAAAEETPKQQTILAVSSLSFLRLGAYTEVSLGEGGGGLK